MSSADPEGEGDGFDFLADDPQTQEEPDFPFTQEETPSAPETEAVNWEEAFAEDDSELPGERPEAQPGPLGEGDDFYFTTEDLQAEEEPDFLFTQEESSAGSGGRRRELGGGFCRGRLRTR